MTKDGKQDGRATLAEMFAVMRDPSLTSDEKVLWALYRSYERPDRGAYCGVETLAEHMDASTRSIERYRTSLIRDEEGKERGYLEQKFRGPLPAEYRACVPSEAPTVVSGQGVKAPTRMSEQDTESPDSGVGTRGESPDTSPDSAVGQVRGVREEKLLPPPIPSPREGSDAESGTYPLSQVPGEEVALRAEVEAGTAPPSSLPSENGRPGAGRFPSRELVELVRAEWWCGDLPPPDAPPAWTEGAECRFLERRIWPRLGDEGTRLFVRGVRLLAEADDTDLCVRAGDSGEPRPLLPAEGFTGALVQAWLRQNPGLPHEAVGAARKADELNHARDGPASGQHDSGPLRALATEVVNATERGA